MALSQPKIWLRSSVDSGNLKGKSLGEFLEVQFAKDRPGGLDSPGFNHLNVYVTARLYWDADQDIEVLLLILIPRCSGWIGGLISCT